MMASSLSIAILAGGQSSRMGTDKALLPFPPDGTPLLQIVLDRVQPLSDDIFVVSRARPEYERFGVPIKSDLYTNAAVLGGIGSALRHARNHSCLVVSCDHPFLNKNLLSAMAAEEGEWDILVPALPGQSRQGGFVVRHTLHAIYRRSCLPAIEQSIRHGRLQIVSFFDRVRVREVDNEYVARFDPEFRSFLSVNTPEAYEGAIRLAAT